MHEMALATGILGVVLDVADEEPVQRVRVRVGTLQRVVPDSLQFSFRLLADGTPASDALLEIKQVPARIRCKTCGAKTTLKAALFACKFCGTSNVEILSGDELVVDALHLSSGWRYRPRASEEKTSLDHLLVHAEEGPTPVS
jgi:hydrogenase nickel incorporation protein HypA/HybF